MTIYVICCNDSIEYAIIDNEKKAKRKLKWFKKKHPHPDPQLGSGLFYWHIHEVEGE